MVGYPVTSRSFGRKIETLPERGGLASRDRESGSGAGEDRRLAVVPARRSSVLQKSVGDALTQRSTLHGSFLTKFRARVAGGLAWLLSRGATAERRRQRRQRAKKHREPDRGGKAARSGKDEVRNATTAVMRRRRATRDRVTHRGKALRVVEARSFHEGVSQTILAAPDEAVRAKAPALLGWGGDRSVRGYGPSSAATRRENLPPSDTTRDPPKRKRRRETPLPLTAQGNL